MKKPKDAAPAVDAGAPEMPSAPVYRGEQVQISSHNARRRAGMLFGPEPVVVAVADLSEEQIEQLKNDPQLVVRAFATKEPAEGE